MKRLTTTLTIILMLLSSGMAGASIDWDAAQQKIRDAQWWYENVPEVKAAINRDCTTTETPAVVPPVVEPETGYPPGWYVPSAHKPEPVIVPEKPKTVLSDYVPEQAIPKWGVERMDKPGEPWNFQGATNKYLGTLTKIRQDEYVLLGSLHVTVLRTVLEHYFYQIYPAEDDDDPLKCLLVIGDASARAGDHSYHNTKKFDILDVNYFTFGDNITHYRLSNKSHLEQIWLDDEHAIINEAVFDSQKNYDFFLMIHQVFPKSRIMVSKGIKAHLRHFGNVDHLQPGYDYEYWNHWRHAHITLGAKINWECVLNIKLPLKE